MPTQYQGSREEIDALNAFIKLTRAAESVNLRINAHLKKHRLTVSQFGVLEALFHLGPQLSSELGDKILKSSGNMTTVIDNLENRKLVYRIRRPEDRRCIDVHLTDEGQKLIEAILPAHIAGVVKTFQVLSSAELGQLGALCKKVGIQ